MSKKGFFLLAALVMTSLSIWEFLKIEDEHTDFSKRVKVGLREVGNQMLLTNSDNSSLVLPIIELNDRTFQMSFENKLSILPDSIVSVVKSTFSKVGVNTAYNIEVIECKSSEVAYSFQVEERGVWDVVPCKGRELPKDCYQVEVTFKKSSLFWMNELGYWYGLAGLICFGFVYAFRKNKNGKSDKNVNQESITLGSFEFFPTENKLVKKAETIKLSGKECEILAIFVAKPNQIIKRDELSKKVWEDKGVFVGRSLDTYISKLRKKLEVDSSIKLTNIHGVGYRLELD